MCYIIICVKSATEFLITDFFFGIFQWLKNFLCWLKARLKAKSWYCGGNPEKSMHGCKILLHASAELIWSRVHTARLNQLLILLSQYSSLYGSSTVADPWTGVGKGVFSACTETDVCTVCSVLVLLIPDSGIQTEPVF